MIPYDFIFIFLISLIGGFLTYLILGLTDKRNQHINKCLNDLENKKEGEVKE